LDHQKSGSFDELTENLDPINAKSVKSNLINVNEAIADAGKSILYVAKLLSEIKKNFKNKNWLDLTESGLLLMSGRVARDLASAYESWLGNSSIPEVALAQVSARTLARIGKVKPSLRLEVENQLKKRNKYTERDLTNFLRKSNKSSKPLDELIKKAISTMNNFSDDEKLDRFPKLFIENIKLKKRIQNLEKNLFESTNS